MTTSVRRDALSPAIERAERALSKTLGASPRDHAACADALEAAIGLARTDPQAAHWFELSELLGDLADEYEALGRPDDAIAAMREAVDVGWGGAPDGRCRIAEIMMRSGRVDEAAPIWAEVRRDTPDDVWLYNNAGLEYLAIGDYETALEWLTQGLLLAVDTGDPEQLVAQLLDLRQEALTALGIEEDGPQLEGDAFLDEALAGERPTGWPADARPAMAAFDGSEPAPYLAGIPGPASSAPRFTWAWFPADQYDIALRRWPEMTEEGSPASGGRDHAAYCREMQVRLRTAADAGVTSITIAPMIIDEYLRWCDTRGADPALTRAEYAAAFGEAQPERLIAWPPGRNEPCWCGSGRKYKKCCGLPSAAAQPA